MKNKETINRLKWVKIRICDITYSPESLEAIDLAIKALEFIDENCPKTFVDYLNGEQICGKAVQNDTFREL